jgi:hypothetical protein
MNLRRGERERMHPIGRAPGPTAGHARTPGRSRFPPQAFLLLALFLPAGTVSTAGTSVQRRPLLRNSNRDYFAGRFVFVPRDASPRQLQYPRMMARVADHDLITPPVRSLGKPAEIAAWLRELDWADADGAILSLDAIAGEMETIRQIRVGRPGLPIYGFAADGAHLTSAGALAAEGVLDHLVLARETAVAKATIPNASLEEGADSAALLLLARLLNHRFGHVPKIYPVFSAGSAAEAQTETRRIGAKIKTAGGWNLPQTADASLTVDAILYVHAPRTSDAQRASFVENLRQTIEKGGKVAVADLSESPDTQDAPSRLMAELRRLKLLDKLAAYSRAEPTSTGDALNQAVAHVSTLLAAIKFLRDDLPRLRRIDTAQVTLLLNRYLSEWAYPSRVRPALEAFAREQLQTEPDRLASQAERAAAFAFERLKPVADELFREQFRRNIHAILLNRGERVLFEIHSFQRLQVRFTTGKSSEAEIILSLLIPQITFPDLPPSTTPRTEWTLTANPGDERIGRRIESVVWADFKTGAESVEVTIRLSPQSAASPESYRIVSALKRRTRRIEITAPTQQGAFYALAKLEQLGAEGKLAADFQVEESPSFPRRGIVEGFYGPAWSHRNRLEMMRFLGRVRMNRYVYAPKDDPLHRERWRESYSGRGLERFQHLLQAANDNFVELVYAINPGLSIAYSSEADLAALLRKLDQMTAIGVRHFALAFDDVPESLQRPEDRAKFPTLAAAQAHIIRRVHEHLRRQSTGGGELLLVPTVYSGERGDRAYLRELGAAVPADVPIFWTGMSVFSPAYTAAQAKEWRSLIARPPLVWDNFPVNDDANWRLFLGPKRGAAPDLPAETAGFIANPMIQMRASWLALATSAAYAWNARQYNPATAHETALHLLYDERTRAAMRIWAAAYGGAHHEAHLFDPLFASTDREIALAGAEAQLAALQRAYESIGATRDQGLLRGELAAIVERTRQAIEGIKFDRK